MVSKHPKVTVYIPQRLLEGLDIWKQNYNCDSRSEAIVTILEDYLEGMYLVQYEEPQKSAAPPKPSLSLVIEEINDLKERMTALEESMDAAQEEEEEEPSTVLAEPEPLDVSNVPGEALHTAPAKMTEPDKTQSNNLEEQLGTAHGEVRSTAQVNIEESKVSDVPSEAPSTALIKAPFTPLTQSALAKRLGCSVQVVEKHRKQGEESFACWSRQHDPDDLAWRWEGRGVRGNPLRFMPAATKAE